jgi:hypothetical protein
LAAFRNLLDRWADEFDLDDASEAVSGSGTAMPPVSHLSVSALWGSGVARRLTA